MNNYLAVCAALTVTLCLGTVLGRVRPYHRLRERAFWFLVTVKPQPWAHTKIALAFMVLPDRLVYAVWKYWRDRNKPVPKPVEVKLSPEWQAKVDQARARDEQGDR